jgi:branched-subunit amino acid aminotransferase/4-amino-4-deoxychorismate lyase
MASESHLVSVNKSYLLASDYQLGLSNRAYRYGDGFFETMHANGCQVQFVADHWERMQHASRLLHLEFPDYFTFEFFTKQISGLLTRMKLFQAARVKVSVIRDSEGYYIPNSNKCDVVIEASYLGKGHYELDDKPLILGIFEESPKPRAAYMQVKTMNSLPYILAGIYAKENQFGDVLLVDGQGFLVEATSSNLFAVHEKKLFSPSIETGCVKGIMRKQIIRIAHKLNYEVADDAFVNNG